MLPVYASAAYISTGLCVEATAILKNAVRLEKREREVRHDWQSEEPRSGKDAGAL
jgi:hypothetical protein